VLGNLKCILHSLLLSISIAENGAIGGIFSDWIKKAMPDRAEKVLHQIAECHGGNLNDSEFGRRMKGS
tara:strand:- start:78 stop:281 length:204 start_codon:yes stop_codon:yes gene_type:complete